MEERIEQVATVRDLEEAIGLIFENNFDTESKACLITLMKIIDNILQKPNDPKVRTIRLQNAAFSNKVGSRKGGIEFLLACGFERTRAPPPLLATADTGEEQLLLNDDTQSRLVTARRLLMTRAIQDLCMKAEELPEYRQPPVISLVDSTSQSSITASATEFNPYVGHRFDAKSMAVGANLGPDPNYKSKTDAELRKLLEKQAKLEAQRQKLNPEWCAFRPDEPVVIAVASSATASSSQAEGPSDSSLLAERMKKQQQERMQREQGGFTTKAMRDLEKLKKQKVYSHVTLTVQFPDGYKLVGKFVPSDKIRSVQQSLQQDCLTVQDEFDLYVTPPRRLLSPTQSLKQEDLVPAAKVFVSWKQTPPSAPYLKPILFQGVQPVSFPDAKPIVADSQNDKNTKPSSNEGTAKSNKSATDRENDLLRKMMGGAKSALGGGSKKDSSSTTKKPKWFKS